MVRWGYVAAGVISPLLVVAAIDAPLYLAYRKVSERMEEVGEDLNERIKGLEANLEDCRRISEEIHEDPHPHHGFLVEDVGIYSDDNGRPYTSVTGVAADGWRAVFEIKGDHSKRYSDSVGARAYVPAGFKSELEVNFPGGTRVYELERDLLRISK